MIHTSLFFPLLVPLLIQVSELNLLICYLVYVLFETIKTPLGLMMAILGGFPSPFRLFVVRTVVFYACLYPLSDILQIRVDFSSLSRNWLTLKRRPLVLSSSGISLDGSLV